MKSKKDVQSQVREELPEFAEALANLTASELNERLATLAKNAEELQEAKEADDELASARERSTELGAPYRDGKKMIRLKSRYVISLLKERA